MRERMAVELLALVLALSMMGFGLLGIARTGEDILATLLEALPV